MKSGLWALLFSLSVGCGHVSPKHSELPTASVKKSSLTQATATMPVSPFKTESEEEFFWKILNFEVDFAMIPKTPVNLLAIYLAGTLSTNLSAEDRFEAFQYLLGKYQCFSTVAEDQKIKEAIANNQYLEERWVALQIIIKRDIEANQLLTYVLNNKKRIKEYFDKDAIRRKKANKNEVEKPSPAPRPPSVPTQPF